RQLAQKLNREPTQEELAKESGFTERRVQELLDLVEDPVSLETPVGDGESMYADLIEDIHSERPDESTSQKLRQVELADALLLLNPRMRRVLSLRFGLDGNPPQTLEEVGAGLGITRERVRQLEARALRELRLGYELTPAPALLDEDPHRYVLEGTDRVLMEVPFAGPADLVLALAEHVEAAGLKPVIAHPERTEAVLADPFIAEELASRGWDLQVNATSLVGRHGPEPEELGWSLLERGIATV